MSWFRSKKYETNDQGFYQCPLSKKSALHWGRSANHFEITVQPSDPAFMLTIQSYPRYDLNHLEGDRLPLGVQ